MGIGRAGRGGEGQGRLDGAGGALQGPIAAGPRRVVGGRHVGPGQPGQARHQKVPLGAGRHVAAPEQEVALGVQGLADGRQVGGAALQVVGAEPAVAEQQRAVAPVADQVQRVDARAAGQHLAHLRQAVPLRRQAIHLGARRHARHQALDIGQVGLNEHDLAASRRDGLGGAGDRGRGVSGRGVVGRRAAAVAVVARVGGIGHGGAIEHPARLQGQQGGRVEGGHGLPLGVADCAPIVRAGPLTKAERNYRIRALFLCRSVRKSMRACQRQWFLFAAATGSLRAQGPVERMPAASSGPPRSRGLGISSESSRFSVLSRNMMPYITYRSFGARDRIPILTSD